MGALTLYNSIIISGNPRGYFFTGVCSGALKPGTVCQVKSAVEKINGLFTYEPYSRDADSNRPKGPILICIEDRPQGKLPGDAYTDGAVGQFYCPIPGDELMMLLQDVAGTGDAHTIGEILIIDSGTGTLLVTTGSPEVEPFVCLETIAAPSADTFAHTQFTGF